MTNEEEVIRIIVKNPYEFYNSRSLSKIIGISHVGMFKLLKKLEREGVLVSKSIGKARIYSINFENDLAAKKAGFALLLEGYSNMRWIKEFKGIENVDGFIILFGSILKNSSEAKDIDLLIVADKKEFEDLRKFIADKNKILEKKVHLLLQTKEDFLKDLRNKNKVTLEIIKTGRVLFGQNKFIQVLKEK